MNKQKVKKVLMSLRTQENEAQINNLLGKIDIMDEKSLNTFLENGLNDEEALRNFLISELSKRTHNQDEERYAINDMLTYGITGKCIHLHLPVDLHQMILEKGIFGTRDIVNLYLLDALEKIKELKEKGFNRFQGKQEVYMMSSLLSGKEMKFLEDMGFTTKTYRRKDLNNNNFIEEHLEARSIVQHLGKDRNVGTAIISLETIDSKEWQDKKKQKVQELAEKGITLQENFQIKE